MINEAGFIKQYSRLRIIFLIASGLIAGCMIPGIVFALITVSTFENAECIMLTDPQSIAAKWYYSSIILTAFVMTAGMIMLVFKNWLRIFSTGVLLSVFLPAIIFFRVKDDFKNDDQYYTTFNEQYWKRSFYKPLPMARWMDKTNYLTGRTSLEVVDILGNPPQRSGIKDDSVYLYQLEMYEVQLQIIFKNNRAISESVTCNFN